MFKPLIRKNVCYNPVTVNLFSPIQSIGSHKKLSFASILSLLSHIEIRHNAAVSCPCKQSIYSVVFLGFLNMFGSPLCSVSNSVLTDLDHYRFYRHHVIMPKQIALDQPFHVDLNSAVYLISLCICCSYDSVIRSS